jgi:CHAD domain-containing protein
MARLPRAAQADVARDGPPRATGALAAKRPPIALPRRARFAELVDAVLAECRSAVFDAETEVRADAGAAGVHRMRVAVRRLRSALRLLRDALGRARAERLRDGLEPLADALGAVRDLDVFLARVALCETLGAPSTQEIASRAAEARREAFGALVRQLDSDAWAQRRVELELLRARARRGSASSARLGMPASGAARELVGLADRRALRAGRGYAELSPDQRHRLRLRVKAARYATELFAPLLPAKAARRYVRRAVELQDALGVECDAARTRSLVARLGASSAEPGVAFLLGHAAGQASQARPECDRAWRRFRRAPRPWK